MVRELRRLRVLLALPLIGFVLIACGDDDDNGDTLPTTAIATPTPIGDDDSLDLGERYSDLQREYESLSDDAQQEVEEFWNNTTSLFSEWQAATDDAMDDLQERFDEALDELEEAIDNARDQADDN